MSRTPEGPGPAAHLRRWRLVLGRYAERHLDPALSREDQRVDRVLGYLYEREMASRGLKTERKRRFGSLDASQLTLPQWLHEVHTLFPQSVFETIQDHAIDRYEMHGLLNDPEVLESLTPNQDLLRTLMLFKGRANPAVQSKVREVARKVVEQIMARLRPRVERALSGRRNRFRRSQLKVAQNFDWRATIRSNLVNYDRERKRLIAERLHFHARMKRHLPWTIILCVDQSGSMLDSVMHSAVMAAILAGLPSVKLHLVVFDTAVVDLTEQVADPVEVLMSVQLGGGTDIGRAMRYCAGLVKQPTRTICVLISDFCEGAPPAALIGTVRSLAEARVHLLGLAALDGDATPDFDRQTADRLSAAGMQIAALTPDRFAEWLGEVMQ